MTKQLLILGGGTGGVIVANRLRRMDPELAITMIEPSPVHTYQPGLLFVPFGKGTVEEFQRPLERQLHSGVKLLQTKVESVDINAHTVATTSGDTLRYDVLVVATGATLLPEETDGLLGEGWGKNAFTFYDPAGSAALAKAMDSFASGRLVVNVIDMPIKCPVAPLEFSFLAEAFFTDRHVRDQVDITYVTPLDSAFTKPVASARLGRLMEERGIKVIPSFNTGQVDESGNRLISYDGQEVHYDLLVSVPLHGGAPYVSNSPGLGDEINFIPTDEATLQSLVAPEVFVIGDAAGLSVSKAGSVAHFEGEVITKNILAFLAGKPLPARFDGHANCFIETGHRKALLIDFNTSIEPLPGHFPGPFGLPLLKESWLNHLGKLAFETMYWHALLPGISIPLIGPEMPTRGKGSLAVTEL